jgi:hypothetical protein
MYQMLQSVIRNHGRALASAPTILTCKAESVLSQEEFEILRQEQTQQVESGLSGDREQLIEALYEIAVTKLEKYPVSIIPALLQETSNVDVTLVLVSTILCLGSIPVIGGANLLQHARLHADTKKESISQVKDLLLIHAKGGRGGRLPDLSTILLGVMASWKVQPRMILARSELAGSSEEIVSTEPQFSYLPTAMPGSLLDATLHHIQTCYEAAFKAEKLLARNSPLQQISSLLHTLEGLSLSDQFASLFLDPLIHQKSEMEQLKVACTSLLLSQVSGRRRAAFDGREFYNMVLRISSEPYPSFRAIMESDSSAAILLRAAAEVVPKVPTDASEAALSSLLSLCIEHLSNESNSWILVWLSSLQDLFESAAGEKAKLKMSPRTINFLRRYTMHDVFTGLSTSTMEPHCEPVLLSYIACLGQIPMSTLEEANFFSIKSYDSLAKQCFVVHCLAILIQHGHMVEQAPRELSKSVAWYIQQQKSSTLLQRLACSIADASRKVSKSDVNRDMLLLILEGLLEKTVNRTVGLELLSILLARWQSPSSESDLSMTFLFCANGMDAIRNMSALTLQQTVALLVHNLPFHLASFCRQERLSMLVSNRLWRIYSSWSETRSDGDSILLDCVRKALVCCSDANSGEEQFVIAVSSLLLDDSS